MMENLEDIKKYSVNGIIVSDPNTSEYRRGSIYFVNAKPSLSFCTIFCSQLVNTYFDKRRLAKLILYFGSFIAYNAYVMEAVRLSWNNDDKGKDVRLLVTLTFIAYATVIYYGLLRKRVLRNTWRNLKKKLRTTNYLTPFLAKLTWCVLYGILLGFIISDARGQHLRLVSMAGLLSILVFGYIFSFNRSKIKWHPVIWGIFIQYVIGLVTLRWKFGQGILRFVDIKVLEFLGYTDYGSSAVYGYLVNGELTEVATSDYVFVYKNLSVIIMVSVCTSVLYHYGIMQNVIMKVGWLLEKTMDTTCCESMAAAANIILTMPEACLTIKPYMGIMTMSEIHAVLTSGFSTIACNVFVAYVRLGARADYLMVASIFSAPASLAFAKLFYPETERSKTRFWNIVVYKGESSSCMDAIVTGATNGMALILKLSGNLIGFISFISFINFLPGWFGGLVGLDFLSAELTSSF